VSFELLYTKLETLGVALRRKTLLSDDIEYLRELELIELNQAYRQGTYQLAVPILGMWIRTSINFDDAVARAREESEQAVQ
jgi:hypothetical protein